MCPAQVKFPESYTAYAFIKPGGKLERITVPWRFPEDGEIVVKVLACGVCGTCVPLLPTRPICDFSGC